MQIPDILDEKHPFTEEGYPTYLYGTDNFSGYDTRTEITEEKARMPITSVNWLSRHSSKDRNYRNGKPTWRKYMNIQIFGTKKSKDSQKAERFFKERGIKFQYVDMKMKGLSKGEFESVRKAVGGLEAMIDRNCKDKDLLALITYIAEENRAEKVLENQSVLLLPIVRNGKQATVGYQPDVWKKWE